MTSMVAAAQKDSEPWHGDQRIEATEEIATMHTGIGRTYFHAPSKEGACVEWSKEMWTSDCPEYGRLRVPLYGLGDAAANWQGAYAKVLTKHVATRGIASPCSFYSGER